MRLALLKQDYMVNPYPDAPAQRTSNTGNWIDRHRSPRDYNQMPEQSKSGFGIILVHMMLLFLKDVVYILENNSILGFNLDYQLSNLLLCENAIAPKCAQDSGQVPTANPRTMTPIPNVPFVCQDLVTSRAGYCYCFPLAGVE